MRGSVALLGSFVVGGLVLAFASDASGHAHMTFPMRRSNCQGGDDAACKTAGPCGGTPNPMITPTTFFVGSSYTLTWSETIEHPGTFQMNLATNGEASQAAFNRVVMADGAVPDQVGTGPHAYQVTWIAPDTDQCNPCVMQMIQDMENPPQTGNLADPYYNCADVRILPAGASTPTPNPTTTATPNPGNDDDPITVDGYGSCSVGAASSAGGAGFALLVLLGAVIRRRRS